MTSFLQRLREWSSLLPLLLLLGAAYWLNLQVQPLPGKPDSGKRHAADFIVSRFSATTLDEQGAPRFLMTAQKMTHYPDNDSTHLEDPQLASFFPARPTIYTSAKRGEISSKGEEVFLRDEVRLVRAGSATQSVMAFSTAYLHVVPDSELADTDQPVTMTDAHNVVHAVGMQLDNKARMIKLLAQVRSQHEPAKKQ
jgi:lipopolysaccharide export system protein LptC